VLKLTQPFSKFNIFLKNCRNEIFVAVMVSRSYSIFLECVSRMFQSLHVTEAPKKGCHFQYGSKVKIPMSRSSLAKLRRDVKKFLPGLNSSTRCQFFSLWPDLWQPLVLYGDAGQFHGDRTWFQFILSKHVYSLYKSM